MKKNLLKRFIIGSSIILLFTLFSDAQVVWDTLPYKQYADFKLQNLNKSFIQTGILYDRVMPIADIERFKQQDQFSDTTGPRHWLQAYYELFHSAFNTNSWLTPQALDAALDINPNMDNGIPIGILNYKYNIMDTNAYMDNLIDTLPNGQFVDVAG